MNILLIEDDKDLCEALAFEFNRENHKIDCCYNGADAVLYLDQGIYDLVLLDCMLPGMSGLEILKEMRGRKDLTPVIILSALGEVSNRVTGLEYGADDYLVKPFDFAELMARIHSIFRRRSSFSEEKPSFGDLSFDPSQNILYCKDRQCPLSQTEAELLKLLLCSGEKTASRSTLLKKIWGIDTDVEDSNLDNYIYFLRRRLRSLSSSVSIENRRGQGYYLKIV